MPNKLYKIITVIEKLNIACKYCQQSDTEVLKKENIFLYFKIKIKFKKNYLEI